MIQSDGAPKRAPDKGLRRGSVRRFRDYGSDEQNQQRREAALRRRLSPSMLHCSWSYGAGAESTPTPRAAWFRRCGRLVLAADRIFNLCGWIQPPLAEESHILSSIPTIRMEAVN